MKMIHIVDGPPLQTNCFLLLGNAGNAAVIDPAAPAQQFVSALEANGAKLSHILLTHAHHDHVASVQVLREKYGAKLCMHAADAAQFNMQPDETYTDFGKIEVDDMVFTTIFTPGHTPGSTCIRVLDKLFSGDTLFLECIGRTDFEGGSKKQMTESLKKLVENVEDHVQVFPGHEEFTSMGHEKKYNRYLCF